MYVRQKLNDSYILEFYIQLKRSVVIQEQDLSDENMEALKIENIKEEVSDMVNLSTIKVNHDGGYMIQMIFKCDNPMDEPGSDSVKYENSDRKEISTYDREMSIKTETNEMKHEVEIGHALDYEELTSIKTEDYIRDGGDEYIQHAVPKCYPSLDRLDFSHGQCVNKDETIKYGRNFDRENNCEYETDNLSMKQKAEDNSTLQTQIKITNKKNVKYFKCQFCEHITHHLTALKCHFLRRHNENPVFYQCFNCEYKTEVKYYLRQHCREQHNRKVEWQKCCLCDFKTKYRRHLLRHHKMKHDDAAEILYCEQCDFKTKNKLTLLRHRRSKHDDTAEIFHCELCFFKTKYKHYMSQHRRVKHNDAAEIFHCEQCDFKTKYKKNLLQHQSSKHDDEAEIFHCDQCNFKTKNKCYMSKHHKLKHGDAAQIFHCKQCGFKTKDKKGLLQHQRLKHDNDAA